MEETNVKDLLALLAGRVKLSGEDTEEFVNAMFGIIRDALMRDRVVKIKGLGTFKVVDVDSRESVNVNTGERVTIEGHGKVAFTPDATMKELVNKPFSQFETVVLNDGVVFGDEEPDAKEPGSEVKEAESEAAEQAPQAQPKAEEKPLAPTLMEAPIYEEAPETVQEAVETYEPDEPLLDTETSAPQSDPVEALLSTEGEQPTEQPEEPQQPDTHEEEHAEEEAEIAEEEEGTDEESDESDGDEGEKGYDDEGRKRMGWKLILFHVTMCIAIFAIGVVAGMFIATELWSPAKPATEVAAPAPVKPETTKPAPAKTDTLTAKDTIPTAKPDTIAKVKTEEPKATSPDEYAQKDVRVRTGAYRIVGLDRSIKAKGGETVKNISDRTLGPGMECYIEVYNDLKGNTPLKAGQEVKIPLLKTKKRLKR